MGPSHCHSSKALAMPILTFQSSLRRPKELAKNCPAFVLLSLQTNHHEINKWQQFGDFHAKLPWEKKEFCYAFQAAWSGVLKRLLLGDFTPLSLCTIAWEAHVFCKENNGTSLNLTDWLHARQKFRLHASFKNAVGIISFTVGGEREVRKDEFKYII